MRLAGGSFARGGPRCWPWASGPCRNLPSEHRLPWIWKRCGSAPRSNISRHTEISTAFLPGAASASRWLPPRANMASWCGTVAAAGTVVVVGAAFLAFHPAGSTDSAPLRESGAYFTSGAAVPAGAQAAQGVELQADVQPRTVTAETVPDVRQVFSVQSSVVPPSGRADASDPNAGAGGGETVRSPAAAASSEPEIATGAAVPAEKSSANDRDRPETSKLAHKHKRSGRRGRDGNEEPKPVGQGYAYAPYGGTPTHRQW